jgi:hypothetical protein
MAACDRRTGPSRSGSRPISFAGAARGSSPNDPLTTLADKNMRIVGGVVYTRTGVCRDSQKIAAGRRRPIGNRGGLCPRPRCRKSGAAVRAHRRPG